MILQLGYIIFIEILHILTSLLIQSYDISITTPSSTIIKDQNLQSYCLIFNPIKIENPIRIPRIQ